MKRVVFIVLVACLTPIFILAQQDTEVYLMDILPIETRMTLLTPDNVYKSLEKSENVSKSLGKPLNISSNEGYDNQPSFLDEDHILFSSTRNGQTDIALYSISKDTKTWISNTPNGSEYSPLKIPGKEAVSAIRLDADGLQRLYQYDLKTGKSEELLNNLKVGYHVWYNKHILVCTVLMENRMDLVVWNIKEGTNYTVEKNVGRSLHKIPNSDLVSYISKAGVTTAIKSLNAASKAIETLQYIGQGKEDVAWLTKNQLLAGDNNGLFLAKADTTKTWELLHEFGPSTLYKMSRIAVSPNGKKLAIVAEPSPDKIVQKQVDSYNAADLDAFVNCYSEDVVVSYFPDKTWYEGHIKMREIYGGLSPANKQYDVTVVNRIMIGNKVIDLEKVTSTDQIQMQVALYDVNNSKIERMTFIFDKPKAANPEPIVQKQLDAYNARDIESFLATYTNDVKLYNFPGTLNTDGLDAMREGYGGMFESTPDLHAAISNRIVIGNMVIDQEEVTANGSKFSAVAIYEVANGKISKVTFVR
jgi:hypothetical protein